MFFFFMIRFLCFGDVWVELGRWVLSIGVRVIKIGLNFFLRSLVEYSCVEKVLGVVDIRGRVSRVWLLSLVFDFCGGRSISFGCSLNGSLLFVVFLDFLRGFLI